jgi:hypothetical protein
MFLAFLLSSFLHSFVIDQIIVMNVDGRVQIEEVSVFFVVVQVIFLYLWVSCNLGPWTDGRRSRPVGLL